MISNKVVTEHFTNYRTSYESFVSLRLIDISYVLRKCPQLQPSPCITPKLRVVLKEKWNEKTMYDLNKILREREVLPQYLVIDHIESGSMIIVFAVLPSIVNDLKHILGSAEQLFEAVGISSISLTGLKLEHPRIEHKGLADIPCDNSERLRFFASIMKEYLESGKNRLLKIMVVGEAGQGKSTLINALMGVEVANEGATFGAGTLQIQEYRINQNGVDIAIWDAPGFGLGSPEEEARTLKSLKEVGGVDLVLFCVRMDTTRFPTRVHTETIVKLNEVFGRGFWRYCLFVLTFANNVKEFCPVGEDMAEFFSQRCITFVDRIREALADHAQLNEVELQLVKAVPIGSHRKSLYRENPWALPDREDWFSMFWIECTKHIHAGSLSSLLQVNSQRIEDAEGALPSDLVGSSTNPSQGLNHSMQYSVAKDDVINRNIPFHEILLQQLEDENSGFFEYVMKFAKERGKHIPVLGHIAGSIEGLKAYLTKKMTK